MHELLLFGQVPPARHGQLLQILAGISGMQPVRIIERHLIFKPKKSPRQWTVHVGGTQAVQEKTNPKAQQGELFYKQLVGVVQEEDFGGSEKVPAVARGEDAVMEDTEAGQDSSASRPDGRYDFNKQVWSLNFYDQPEVAGRRPVTSRLI